VPFYEITFPNHRENVWLLKTFFFFIIGNYFVSNPKGQFSTPVEDLTCLGQKFYSDTNQETQWWGAPNHTEPQPHSLASFSNLWKTWEYLTPKNRFSGAQGTILNLWEASLYGATQQLVQVLSTGHNPAILFLALPCTSGKVGSFHIQEKSKQKETR
jgi:hypothetical protein